MTSKIGSTKSPTSLQDVVASLKVEFASVLEIALKKNHDMFENQCITQQYITQNKLNEYTTKLETLASKFPQTSGVEDIYSTVLSLLQDLKAGSPKDSSVSSNNDKCIDDGNNIDNFENNDEDTDEGNDEILLIEIERMRDKMRNHANDSELFRCFVEESRTTEMKKVREDLANNELQVRTELSVSKIDVALILESIERRIEKLETEIKYNPLVYVGDTVKLTGFALITAISFVTAVYLLRSSK